MEKFIGLFRYEYRMSIRRWNLWLAFGVLFIPYAMTMVSSPEFLLQIPQGTDEIWVVVGEFAYKLNLFMPVVGGIVLADRLVRDRQLKVDEIIHSTAMKRWPYILGKYFAGLLSVLTPILLITLVMCGAAVISGKAPWIILPAAVAAFLGINVPAYAFIAAFSLACPLVMPVRVYQILFTGYWIWGNFIDPRMLPTINGTLLTASGEFVLAGFFRGAFRFEPGQVHTSLDAVLNLVVLAACAVLALTAANQYLAWQSRQA